MARHFLAEFLLPLVKGGALHVGRPLGLRAVQRIGAGLGIADVDVGSRAFTPDAPDGRDADVPDAAAAADALLTTEMAGADRDALAELATYRRQCITSLLPAASPPPLDAVALRLGASVHNLLALGHPEIAARGFEGRQQRIAAAAAALAAVGAPASVREAVSRHSLLARLPEIVRSDRTVHFWVGRRTFVGRIPPRRITALPRLRSVRVDLTRRGWLREIGIPAVGRAAFLALNVASPLGEALDPLRLEPPLAWSRILSVLRFPPLCRAVAGRALELGVRRAGEAFADALFRFASLQEPPGGVVAGGEALRFAIRFLAHLVWLDLLFGDATPGHAEGGGDAAAGFGIELAVILVAAQRTSTDLVWPADLPRDGDLGRAFAARLQAMTGRVLAQNAPRFESALGIAGLAASGPAPARDAPDP
jgi:hypothetical protein